MAKHRVGFWALAVMTTVMAPRVAGAVILDPEFQESAFAPALSQISGIAWAPDGSNRLFILRKAGLIRIVEDGVLLSTPFATIAPIETASECGLIGIAFDPAFIDNGYVYVFVTVSVTEQQIIRYRANGNLGEEKTVIVAGLPTLGANHDGGAIGFGPDGKLYWAVGDNGSKARVQDDLLSLAAKVGRANRDGSVPSDNPFVDGDGPNNDYIWARGFRNPFTMTFQPATDRLWLNVVGTLYEQVFTPQAGDNAGWNLYENAQPAGFLSPVIAYRTNTALVSQIVASGAARTKGRVTLTTQDAVRFRPGAKIVVAGVTDSSFDGTAYVASVDSDTAFSYLQAGVDATSGGGTATADVIGGAITGGAFFDSSAVPDAYRGNFFFGDYNTGNIMRATLGAKNEVVAVDEWANGRARLVDSALGPDGDLYYAELQGGVFHARYTATSQTLVVSRLNVRMLEGGHAAFNVRLAVAPTKDTKVAVQRKTGDPDVAVSEGASLVFTPSDWATPQRIVLAAATDIDSVDDAATVRVSSTGLPVQNVAVRVTDENVNDQGGGDSAGSAAAAAGGAAGAPATGGAGLVSGGAVSTGDGGELVSASGGAADGEEGSALGGAPSSAGDGSEGRRSSDQASGCGCRVTTEPGSWSVGWGLLLTGSLWLRRRRSRRA